MPYKDVEKQKLAQHQSYLRNKNKVYARSKVTKQKILHKNREHIRAIKNKPCMDCNQEYPWYVMDLDHVREKTARINYLTHNSSHARLLEELEKCEVVCANLSQNQNV
jgi:lysozyme family protein